VPRDLSRLPAVAVFRPARLNFAGVCLWCGVRWWQSPRCITKLAASVWVVCPRCGGGAIGEYDSTCYESVHGVVSMDKASDVVSMITVYLPPALHLVADMHPALTVVVAA
jgi:hypothetical protein